MRSQIVSEREEICQVRMKLIMTGHLQNQERIPQL